MRSLCKLAINNAIEIVQLDLVPAALALEIAEKHRHDLSKMIINWALIDSSVKLERHFFGLKMDFFESDGKVSARVLSLFGVVSESGLVELTVGSELKVEAHVIECYGSAADEWFVVHTEIIVDLETKCAHIADLSRYTPLLHCDVGVKAYWLLFFVRLWFECTSTFAINLDCLVCIQEGLAFCEPEV